MPNITRVVGQKKTSWNNVIEHANNISSIRSNESCMKEEAISKLFANDELVDVLKRLSKV